MNPFDMSQSDDLRLIADTMEVMRQVAIDYIERDTGQEPELRSAHLNFFAMTGGPAQLRRIANQLEAEAIEQERREHPIVTVVDDASKYEGMMSVEHWQRVFGFQVIAPDGWRYAGIEFNLQELMSAEKFIGLSQNSTISNVSAWGAARAKLGDLGFMAPFPPKSVVLDLGNEAF